MDLVDLIVTPFYILVICFIAYGYQSNNRSNFLVSNYFLSAYFLRIAGGMAFAFVYAFYYGGGDTLNYHYDSTIISNALRSDPINGLELLFTNPDFEDASTYKYVSKMIFKTDPASHIISALAACFNIFTFDSFLATTIFFSLIGFWGNWQLFKTLCQLFPYLHKQLAIGCLYLPSILFWTSGLMKDTLCTMAICYLFSAIVKVFVFQNRSIGNYVVIICSTWILFALKIYILLCFIPTISIYIFSIINSRIKNPVNRKIMKPFFYGMALLFAYFAFNTISETNKKYSLDSLEKTAKITADYIGKVSVNSGGSFYSLGDLDFSPSSIPLLALKAFNVTFYRPYLWEISSPLMVFSVIESLYFIYLSYLMLIHFKNHSKDLKKTFTPFTSFCFLFAISFSFVVGVTSNNFGALARYKSLMLPFFVCGVYVTINRDKTKYANIKTHQIQ